jgi:hypothetical protein
MERMRPGLKELELRVDYCHAAQRERVGCQGKEKGQGRAAWRGKITGKRRGSDCALTLSSRDPEPVRQAAKLLASWPLGSLGSWPAWLLARSRHKDDNAEIPDIATHACSSGAKAMVMAMAMAQV